MRSRRSRLFAPRAFGVLLALFAPSSTSCSGECNARVYDDLIRVVLPDSLPTSGATICVEDDCQPALPTDPVGSPSTFVANGETVRFPHAVERHLKGLGSGPAKIRLVTAGAAPIDAMITTRPTTDTHGGCTTQRLFGLHYDPATSSLASGPEVAWWER